MTELTCWPLDNKPYTSVALGAAYAARSRGVLNADSFTATTNGDNTITVGKGVGCIHVSEQWAAFPLNEGDVLLTFADADGVYPRWDVIALVYDKNANTAGLEVRTGLAAETPALPALRRNDDYDEIFLYRVTRPVGATKITADNVVDLRLDGAVCGLMRDTIDAIDTKVMQEQFAAFLTQIETELKQLHAGTATMLRTVYDPQGKNTDIFAYTDGKSAAILKKVEPLTSANAGLTTRSTGASIWARALRKPSMQLFRLAHSMICTSGTTGLSAVSTTVLGRLIIFCTLAISNVQQTMCSLCRTLACTMRL